MDRQRIRMDVIIEANMLINRKLGRYATTPLLGLFREVHSHLNRTANTSLTEAELVFGWLIQQGRIELRCFGTNIWARYRALGSLPLDTPTVSLGFDDIPIFRELMKAEREAQAARDTLKAAQASERRTQQSLEGVYARIRAATSSTPEAWVLHALS